jgi:hypothetical protein
MMFSACKKRKERAMWQAAWETVQLAHTGVHGAGGTIGHAHFDSAVCRHSQRSIAAVRAELEAYDATNRERDSRRYQQTLGVYTYGRKNK